MGSGTRITPFSANWPPAQIILNFHNIPKRKNKSEQVLRVLDRRMFDGTNGSAFRRRCNMGSFIREPDFPVQVVSTTRITAIIRAESLPDSYTLVSVTMDKIGNRSSQVCRAQSMLERHGLIGGVMNRIWRYLNQFVWWFKTRRIGIALSFRPAFSFRDKLRLLFTFLFVLVGISLAL